MKQEEMVQEVANRCGISKGKAQQVLTEFVDVIRNDVVKNENSIRIHNLGTFKVEHRSAKVHKARTIFKGTDRERPYPEVKVPAKRVLKFKATLVNRVVEA